MGQSPQTPQPPPPAQPSGGGLEPNVAALLGYLLFIPAILWLVLEPYKNDRFVRFHALQTIALWVVIVGLSIALSIVSGVIMFIPGVNLLLLVIWPLFGLAIFVVWILLMVKAYSKQMYKLPIVGAIVEKMAG